MTTEGAGSHSQAMLKQAGGGRGDSSERRRIWRGDWLGHHEVSPHSVQTRTFHSHIIGQQTLCFDISTIFAEYRRILRAATPHSTGSATLLRPPRPTDQGGRGSWRSKAGGWSHSHLPSPSLSHKASERERANECSPTLPLQSSARCRCGASRMFGFRRIPILGRREWNMS